MPHVTTPDGTRLYYEEAGTGSPVIFVHEYAGDYRTWEPQLRYFSRSYRCVTYSQRGYPPSDVPTDPARYGQDIARDDIIAIPKTASAARLAENLGALDHALNASALAELDALFAPPRRAEPLAML